MPYFNTRRAIDKEIREQPKRFNFRHGFIDLQSPEGNRAVKRI